MISAGDFKNGITLEIDGNVCQIVEFQHVKPGKGAAFVRTKYKNIITRRPFPDNWHDPLILHIQPKLEFQEIPPNPFDVFDSQSSLQLV